MFMESRLTRNMATELFHLVKIIQNIVVQTSWLPQVVNQIRRHDSRQSVTGPPNGLSLTVAPT